MYCIHWTSQVHRPHVLQFTILTDQNASHKFAKSRIVSCPSLLYSVPQNLTMSYTCWLWHSSNAC